jgi:anthranilate synthase component 2
VSKLLIIDNYDSFTFTINHYFNHLGKSTVVLKNDDLRLKNISRKDFSHIVLSPGPGHPINSGYTLEVINNYCKQFPILGVCLGHQAIIHAFGGRITHAPQVMHGKLSKIKHCKTGLFKNVPNRIQVARYHSLVVDKDYMPPQFKVTAWTDDSFQVVMAFEHEIYPLYGVQYHPEAILTEHGYTVLKNFINVNHESTEP